MKLHIISNLISAHSDIFILILSKENVRISPSAEFITALTLDHYFSPDVYPNGNLIAESTTMSIILFALYIGRPRLALIMYLNNKSAFTLCIWRHQQQMSIYSLYLETSRTNKFLLFVFADINNITYDVWSFVLVVGEPVFRPLVKIIAFSSIMLSSLPD